MRTSYELKIVPVLAFRIYTMTRFTYNYVSLEKDDVSNYIAIKIPLISEQDERSFFLVALYTLIYKKIRIVGILVVTS